MSLLLVKTIHIVAVVSWFAGLFYLGRIFVYHREALDKPEPDQRILTDHFKTMEGRVYKIIMSPAMVLTWLTGLGLIHLYGLEWFKMSTWLHYKMIAVILLTIYHSYCKKVSTTLGQKSVPFSSFGFRLFNEVPTLFLITIAALAIYKNTISLTSLFSSLFLIVVVLIILTKLYKALREK
jgi:putative membrane protein